MKKYERRYQHLAARDMKDQILSKVSYKANNQKREEQNNKDSFSIPIFFTLTYVCT
jgi:hypothetical protein